MVSSYWDMAVRWSIMERWTPTCSETAGEHMMVFAKIEPFLAELREMFQEPKAFYHLEKVVMDMPNGAEKVRKTQEWMRSMAGGQAEEAAAA